MFTDQPVTPVRLEILIDLLRSRRGGLSRQEVYQLLQPAPLDPDPKLGAAKETVKAGLDLKLIEEDQRQLKLTDICKKQADSRLAILVAFDAVVLSSLTVEKYFALYYAFYLGKGKTVYDHTIKTADLRADEFNQDVFLGDRQSNPFNKDKLTGFNRWVNYVGLGWHDPDNNFQANPYERLLRAFPRIFSDKHKLESDEFMERLADICPELDGGEIFLKSNSDWKFESHDCSLGLSHALIELHEDEVIRLDCPADSQSWSLKEAEPHRDDDFKGDRFITIEWRKK